MSIILELRIQAADVNERRIIQLIVQAAAESVTRAIIFVLTDDALIVIGSQSAVEGILHGFKIVDAAPVVIVGTADDDAEVLVVTETLTYSSAEFRHGDGTDNRRKAS